MAKRSVDRVLEALGLAQPKMRARYGPNACVICTRIAVETFRKHGIRAQPLAVSATVYNPTMTRYWEANDSAGAEQDLHARSVVLGFSGQRAARALGWPRRLHRRGPHPRRPDARPGQ